MKSFKGGKKPANQGSAGKAYEQPVKKSGVPSIAKPGMSKIMFSAQPSGTKGGKPPKKAGK
jgi:hypothetical protein